LFWPVRLELQRIPDPLRVLAYLGSGEICSDYLAPLVAPGREDTVIDAMLAWLAQRKDWDLLDLCDMLQDDPTAPAIRAGIAKHLGKWRERHRYFAPHAPLIGSYDDYLGTLSKKSRYNARKKRRQLEINNQVEHTHHADPATLDEAMSTFIEMHQQRWNEEGLPGVFVNERFVGFHRAMAAEGLRRDWLRLGFLRINDETLFVTYAYQTGGRLYLYQQGGLTNWHHYNLGYVALGFSVADACERGAEVYDFLRGDAEYKQHWARSSRELVQIQAARPGLRGRWFMLHSTINTDDAVRTRIKRLMGRE
ncbi:MAG: GNAT family N-acetyltransferase, partial [Alphaproteobacteria bacterium]